MCSTVAGLCASIKHTFDRVAFLSYGRATTRKSNTGSTVTAVRRERQGRGGGVRWLFRWLPVGDRDLLWASGTRRFFRPVRRSSGWRWTRCGWHHSAPGRASLHRLNVGLRRREWQCRRRSAVASRRRGRSPRRRSRGAPAGSSGQRLARLAYGRAAGESPRARLLARLAQVPCPPSFGSPGAGGRSRSSSWPSRSMRHSAWVAQVQAAPQRRRTQPRWSSSPAIRSGPSPFEPSRVPTLVMSSAS
jgi:hypothetical protein